MREIVCWCAVWRCGDTCAPVSSAPLRGPAKLSRVPPPSRAHLRHPGRCLGRRAAACLGLDPPKQTGHGARARRAQSLD